MPQSMSNNSNTARSLLAKHPTINGSSLSTKDNSNNPMPTPKLRDAVVDIWQVDAADEEYSGFAQLGTAGQTFLRGIQITDAGGLVIFRSIYPGWYPGRTPHIHVKVFPDQQTELTTQFYFQQGLSNVIFANLPPYTTHGPATTSNAQDNWYDPANELAWLLNPSGGLSLYAGTIIGVA